MKYGHLKKLHEAGQMLQDLAKTHGYEEGSPEEEDSETPKEESLEPPDTQDDNKDNEAMLNVHEPNHPLSPAHKKINAGIIIALKKKMGKK